jgi:hypothetical protein
MQKLIFFFLSLQKYQNFLDSLVPHKIPRWGTSVVLLIIYTIRVFLLQGWYIVSYALAIYLLNLFIAFISPKFDPMMEEEEEIGEALHLSLLSLSLSLSPLPPPPSPPPPLFLSLFSLLSLILGD